MLKIQQFIARNRRNRLIAKINNYCLEFNRNYENFDYNFYSNGEYALLKRISDDLSIKIIVDVGANIGEYATLAAKIFPCAKIYALEIVPYTAVQLKAYCKDHANIDVFNIGLSDAEGQEQVKFLPQDYLLSTCVDNLLEISTGIQTQVIDCSVTSGDKFCLQNKIGLIDFLKIDVEGYEHKVIQGFREMLSSGKIRVMQFEYGWASIITKFLLKDFYDYLESFGMKVGKVYPQYVDFNKYHFADETFLGANYVAVSSSEKSLIERLS